MFEKSPGSKNTNIAGILTGGGEMGDRIRQFDWTKTPLGAVENWQQSLITAVNLVLNSRFSMFVWWGEELTYIYNDAYLPTLGTRHPDALGKSAKEVWVEIWDVINWQVEAVIERGESSWNEELLLFLERHGFPEETYHTFSYSPITDDLGKVGGLFCAVSEDTQKVLSRRRLQTLRLLGERTLEEAQSIEEACRVACHTLGENPFDISFSLIYLLNADGKTASLREINGIELNIPEAVRIGTEEDVWEFNRILETGRGEILSDIESKFGKLSAGAWKEDFTREAFVVPLAKAGVQNAPAGFLVCGISPRLKFDEQYRSFLELVAGHIATAVANARALEEERQRAEALAEIDRAKTEFFSNVSHEFRTPLTLMLGNLEEVLAGKGEIGSTEKEQIEAAHRNSLRLLKLVNTLLDFSRIEAGKQQAAFSPLDLSQLTAELASNFRSAIENAGLKLKIDCPPLSEPVFVDREMWEKIVLNLISNAFKFTFAGEIEIALREKESVVELKVKDSGVGIPADQLNDIFKRFHRVRQTQGRTFEGTGIGLSLVQELVKQHGGEISGESELGVGTTFTVTIPKGSAHLPPEQISEKNNSIPTTGTHAEVFLNEIAAESQKSEVRSQKSEVRSQKPQSQILLADDNYDMRGYVQRLLEAEGYEVRAVADGQAALEVLRNEEKLPDLILSDVMMPRVNGFELLEEVRQHQRTRDIPFIMLSARAGEESKVEGLQAGADDYLVKPFAARELLARVRTNLEMARMRRESAQREVHILESIGDCFLALDLEYRFVYFNSCAENYFGVKREEVLGKSLWEVFPAEKEGVFLQKYREALQSQEIVRFEAPSVIKENVWIGMDIFPSASGLSIYFRDITERRKAEESLRTSESQLRLLTDSVPALISYVDADLRYRFINRRYFEWFEVKAEDVIGQPVSKIVGEAAFEKVLPQLKRALAGEWVTYQQLMPYKTAGNRFVEINLVPDKDPGSGRVKGFYAFILDISERKKAEEKLRRVAELDAFRVRLTDVLRGLDSPVEVQSAASRLLGEYLRANRVAYFEVQNDSYYVERDYVSGVPNISGSFPVDSFGDKLLNSYRAGKTVTGFDVETDQDLSVSMRQGFASIQIRSFIGVPLIKEDEFVAGLTVHSAVPRKWTEDEIEIVKETAERTWAAVERARAEKALRESQSHLNLTTEAANIGTWQWNVKTNRIFCNEIQQKMWGYEPSDVVADYSDGARLVLPEHLPNFEAAINECLQGAANYDVEYRIRTYGKNEVRWIRSTGKAFFDENGEAVSIQGISLDITERKEREERLRESEERYRIVAETASDAIISIDQNSRILFVNQAAERIFGYSIEEMVGGDLAMLMPEELGGRHKAGVDRYLNTGKRQLQWESLEIPARHKDGHTFPLEMSFGEYRRNNQRFFIGIARDITERKRIDRALRDYQSLLQGTIDALTKHIAVLNWQGKIINVNAAWRKFAAENSFNNQNYGIGSNYVEECINITNNTEVECDNFGSQAAAGIRQILSEEKSYFEMEYPCHSSTEKRWFVMRVTSFGTGENLHVVVAHENITARKIAELERERLLEREQDLRHQAENANRLKDEFLATVSHELRTPLNAIMGWSTMARNPEADQETIRRALEVIERSARNQNQIISDILEVSRIITGKLQLNPQPVQLPQVINSAVDTVRPAIDAKAISLETKLAADEEFIIGDADRLQQIFWNLLSNAVKFTPDGGRIEVVLTYQNRFAEITVRDNGSGIEPEFLPFVFDRFRQADGKMNRKHGGLGLGLAIVRHLTELHGGQVSVESEGLGAGATFTVRLPLKKSQVKPVQNNLENPVNEDLAASGLIHGSSANLESLKILVVDDEPHSLELASFILAENGAKVFTADSVDNALQIFDNEKLDILISDIGMPERDGYDLIREVKSRTDKQKIPTIALTAYAREIDEKRLLQAGYQAYLPKPLEPARLIEIVSELTSKN